MLNWQQSLAQGFSSAAQLLDFLQLPREVGCHMAEREFKTRVPRGFAARMELGNRYDPLLLQVLAIEEELQSTPGFVDDPLNEASFNTIPGLIHKYYGRVLLTLTGACAINCRYCFRRHFPYADNNPGRAGWQTVLDYIERDASIHEVILSGGDPLLANDAMLAEFFTQLEVIPHLTTIRIHSRIPVVLPERVTDELIQLLINTRFNHVMVLHANHPRELDSSVADVCAKLRRAGCHLLNQSVLLAGVNDDATILAALSTRLFECGVLPYYLHLLDNVNGAAHFEVDSMKAKNIFQQLQTLLPGYLVPKMVREEGGAKHKTLQV